MFGDPTTYENIQIQKNFLETKQNRYNFYFEEILKNKENFDVLYELLKKREHNISHVKMPSIEQHIEFVKNNPYRYWFFL